MAGSTAYALSDALGIEMGLSKKFNKAKGFYWFIGLATIAGLLINLLKINAIQALFYAAIVNGVLAVPLIFVIIKLAGDNRIVGEHKTSKLNTVIAWITFVFMGVSALMMIATLLGWSF